MDVGHVIDALSASLFALLGIWAAVVRRHWFLRFAVVGGLLALALMVPAYEVVIEFGVAMGLIALGVNAARRPRPWRFRWSIETALLAMVVAAVSAAVVGAAPTYGVEQWIRLFGVGFAISYFALLCLWVIYGRARTSVRLLGGIAGIAIFVAVMFVGDGVLYATLQTAASRSASIEDFLQALERWFSSEYAARRMSAILPTVGLGVGVMLAVIAAARASGWFAVDDPTHQKSHASATQWLARIVLCAAFAAVVAPNLYLLYRLCTPPAYPAVHIPVDNGYDDFVAAGRVVERRRLLGLEPDVLSAWSDQKLADIIDQLQEAYACVDAGLSKPCWVPPAYQNDAEMELLVNTVYGALWAVGVRMEYLDRRRQKAEYIAACCQYVRLAHEVSRGQRANWDISNGHEMKAVDRLAQMVGALTATECRELFAQLDRIDRAREPMGLNVERQRAYDYRSNWQLHLWSLLAEWSRQDYADQYEWNLKSDRSRRATMHVLMTDLALQAHFLEHGRLPDSLAELTPDYLGEVPVDSLSGAPLRYHCHGRWYRVYSVGWDEEDDGGFLNDRSGRLNGDYVATGPHLPPLPRGAKKVLAAAAERAQSWLKAAVDAAEKVAPMENGR